jgi:hypothetical protein
VVALLASGLVATTAGTATSATSVVAKSSTVSAAAATPCTRVTFTPAHRIATRYVPNATSPLNRHRFASTYWVRSNCPQLIVSVRQQGKAGLTTLGTVPPGKTLLALPYQQPWQPARYRLVGEHAEGKSFGEWWWSMRMMPTGYPDDVNTPSAKSTKELTVNLDVGPYANGDTDYSAIYSNMWVPLRSGRVVKARPEFASETGAVADFIGLPRYAKVANAKLENRRRTVAFHISTLQPRGLHSESQMVVGKDTN